ncbi:hypothetical protein B0H14DRAFT_3130894 [Mycena olivaceomarginata]|nr:hypothetical protein B0H14DRAFT_3130894 [Mycena olivaceomarginata]
MDAQQHTVTMTPPVETDRPMNTSMTACSVESAQLSIGAAENASLIKNADGFSILGGQFTSAAGNVTVHHHYPHHDTGLASISPINIMDDSFSESEIYSKQILRQKRGFPLYAPEPQQTLPTEYRECGVQIGDVGTITPEGSFDFFFNIFLPSDHPINDSDVPENFQPLSGYKSKDLETQSYGPGGDVSTASVQRLDEGDFPGGDFVFGCRAPQGAVLALPHGSRLQKLKNVEPIREYAAAHAESWFKYVNGRRGRELRGALYAVTGCEKAPSWGMASFHSTDKKFGLSFKPTAAAGGYRWRGNPAKKKCHDPSGLTHAATWNQTMFVHGLSISLGTTVWARIFATVQIRDDNNTDSGLGSVGDTAPSSSQGSSLLSRAFSFLGGGITTGGNYAGASSRAILSDVPPIPQTFHPGQLINDYILDKAPQATVVMSHDDDWCDLLGDDAPGSQVETASQLLQRISDQYDIIEHEGATFLQAMPTPSGSSGGLSSSADTLSTVAPIRRTVVKAKTYRHIPLPHEWADRIAPPVVPYYQEPFPIDLRSDLDLEHLTRVLGNYSIPPGSTIHIMPTARDRNLLQLASGDIPATPVTIVRRLCRTIRGPLSLRVYQSELSPETQQAVYRAFLACGGSRGRKIWQDFLNGDQHPDGPKGGLLLHGHWLLWGFRQDGQHQWIVDVDVEGHRALPHTAHRPQPPAIPTTIPDARARSCDLFFALTVQ